MKKAPNAGMAQSKRWQRSGKNMAQNLRESGKARAVATRDQFSNQMKMIRADAKSNKAGLWAKAGLFFFLFVLQVTLFILDLTQDKIKQKTDEEVVKKRWLLGFPLAASILKLCWWLYYYKTLNVFAFFFELMILGMVIYRFWAAKGNNVIDVSP